MSDKNNIVFRYYSDLHGYLPEFPRDTDKQEVCILAGDVTEHMEKGGRLCEMLTAMCERFMHVILVPGNHEYYKSSILTMEDKVRKRMSDSTNFTLLQGAGHIDFGNVRVIGATMWSDTSKDDWVISASMNDYKFIRTGYPKPGNCYLRPIKPSDTTILHRQHVAAIDTAVQEAKSLGMDTIVVTHHAPSYKSVAKRFVGHFLNSAYVTDIELRQWPDYWIHGHIHENMCYLHYDCMVLANPVGYRGEITGFEPLSNRIVFKIDKPR